MSYKCQYCGYTSKDGNAAFMVPHREKKFATCLKCCKERKIEENKLENNYSIDKYIEKEVFITCDKCKHYFARRDKENDTYICVDCKYITENENQSELKTIIEKISQSQHDRDIDLDIELNNLELLLIEMGALKDE